jgi:hypothetical protein
VEVDKTLNKLQLAMDNDKKSISELKGVWGTEYIQKWIDRLHASLNQETKKTELTYAEEHFHVGGYSQECNTCKNIRNKIPKVCMVCPTSKTSDSPYFQDQDT